jgi:hypothetical protein
MRSILAVLGGATVVLGALALFFNNLIRDWLKQHWKKKSDLELEEAKEHGKIASTTYCRHIRQARALARKPSGRRGRSFGSLH